MASFPQLISFYSSPQPTMLFRGCVGSDTTGSDTTETFLEGKHVIRFSAARFCIGFHDRKQWHPCPHGNRGYAQCFHCRSRDITHVFACLDFSGYEDMEEDYVHQDFSVYLAQFGEVLVKCGVTRTDRIIQRTMEQGADFWVELMRFDDGKKAYGYESMIQKRLDLCNSVRNSTKLALLGKSYRPEKLGRIVEQVLELANKDPDISSFLNPDLSIRANSYYAPRDPKISYKVDGNIMGSKSKLLFYRSEGQDFVVDMSKNTGRLFKMG
jgi:hypothetical protein